MFNLSGVDIGPGLPEIQQSSSRSAGAIDRIVAAMGDGGGDADPGRSRSASGPHGRLEGQEVAAGVGGTGQDADARTV